MTEIQRLELKEAEINAKVASNLGRSQAMLDGFSMACLSGDKAQIESIRDRVLLAYGEILDDIYAQVVLLQKLGKLPKKCAGS